MQIAVIDPDQGQAQHLAAFQFLPVMHLNQDIDIQFNRDGR